MSLSLNNLSSHNDVYRIGHTNSFPEGEKGKARTTEEDDPLSLKKAIKTYRDTQLTGVKQLSDEEKEAIQKQIDEYLQTNKLKTKEDKVAFTDFVRSLFKSYGFNAPIDEYTDDNNDGDKQSYVNAYVEKIFNTPNQPPETAVEDHLMRMARMNNGITYL